MVTYMSSFVDTLQYCAFPLIICLIAAVLLFILSIPAIFFKLEHRIYRSIRWLIVAGFVIFGLTWSLVKNEVTLDECMQIFAFIAVGTWYLSSGHFSEMNAAWRAERALPLGTEVNLVSEGKVILTGRRMQHVYRNRIYLQTATTVASLDTKQLNTYIITLAPTGNIRDEI